LVTKEYFPIDIDGNINENKMNIILYNSEYPDMKYSDYIYRFNNLSSIYGINAINQNDIEICKHYNMNDGLYDNNKRKYE
jgi:hypothetical protein